MPLDKYPLTLGPNMAQEELEICLGEKIDPSEFTTPAFSAEFVVRYGNLVLDRQQLEGAWVQELSSSLIRSPRRIWRL
jgi:hypothetical protein